jgi:Asp-tRNA(Asn)/Glu-tRNA(Gln) amidotransferase C subunit
LQDLKVTNKNKENKEMSNAKVVKFAKEFNNINDLVRLSREYGSVQKQFTCKVLEDVKRLETFKRFAKEVYKHVCLQHNCESKKDLPNDDALKHYQNTAKLLSRAKKELKSSLGVEEPKKVTKSARLKSLEKSLEFCKTSSQLKKYIEDLEKKYEKAKNAK